MTPQRELWQIHLKIPLDRFELSVEYTGSERALGVFGVSGSGKTTLLESIAGLRTGASGNLSFSGRNWLYAEQGVCLPTEHRRVGYVPQDYLLFPHLNVRGNLEFGKERAQQEGVAFDKIFQQVVETFELQELLERSTRRLSGGERQRVALGRALCSGAQVLLLDEPLASLDAGLKRRILPYLIRARDTFGLPMIVVSHDPVELQALCGEVLAMDAGQVIARGQPQDVFMRSDVFDTAKEQGFENVFTGKVTVLRERTMDLKLVGLEETIRVPASDAAIGDERIASLASDDILIATERPRGLSARNCLATRIERIEATGLRYLALTSVGETTFLVELTKDAIDELGLKAGLDVYLVFKTNAVSV